MNQTQTLVDQHVRESEMHLRHVDELIGMAMRKRSEPSVAANVDPLLAQIQQDRDRLALVLQQLNEIPSGDPSYDVRRGHETVHALDAVVLRLRHLLAAMFGPAVH